MTDKTDNTRNNYKQMQDDLIRLDTSIERIKEDFQKSIEDLKGELQQSIRKIKIDLNESIQTILNRKQNI
jgi:gas vesicle protein